METILEEIERDTDFAETIREKSNVNLHLCIQCGTCSGSCPGGRVTAYRTRMIIRQALLGMKKQVLSSEEIWLCTTCKVCTSRCPRGIDITKAILTIRNMAVEAGYSLKSHKNLANQVITSGCALGKDLDQSMQDLRQSYELPRMPESLSSSRDTHALDDFRKLISEVKFDLLMHV